MDIHEAFELVIAAAREVAGDGVWYDRKLFEACTLVEAFVVNHLGED